MSLPAFRYHPDPISTGALVAGDRVCGICGSARGFFYAGSIYCAEPVETICPWCIADGTAAAQLDGVFSDDEPLIGAGVATGVVDEVTRRTPGYSSWQQERWMAHCGDACAFLGDPSKETLIALAGDEPTTFLARESLREEDWRLLLSEYEPGGNPSVYHFRCLHCGASIFTLDFT